MCAERVSIEDLLGAADWLRAYEGPAGVIGDHGAAGDERGVELLRVADWIDAEITRRHIDQGARSIAKRSGVSVARARRALVANLATDGA